MVPYRPTAIFRLCSSFFAFLLWNLSDQSICFSLSGQALGFLVPTSLLTSSALGRIERSASANRNTHRHVKAGLAATRMEAQQTTPKELEKQPIAEMTPRRKQFFRMVSEGLGVGFEGQDVARVRDFVRYCKGELDYEAQGTLHQPSEEYVDGLRAKPWWEPEEFEWISELEEKSSIVIDEFKAFWNDPMSGFAKDSMNMNIMGKGWSGVRLQRLGDWIPDNCSKFPKTVELLKELEIPLAVRGVMFARQVPGSGVSPHTDGRNFILTTHLGDNTILRIAAADLSSDFKWEVCDVVTDATRNLTWLERRRIAQYETGPSAGRDFVFSLCNSRRQCFTP